MPSQLDKITATLKQFFPDSNKTVPLHEPAFLGKEWRYVKECLDTGWISSVGKFVDRFERDLENYTGASHAIVTVNGTAALHICYLLAGVLPNDEVLVPTLTFVATCNALRYCNAIPNFIDCDEKYLGIDVAKLEHYLQDIAVIKNNICYNRFTHHVIRALCVMHTFGHPVDLDPLLELSKKYHLILIEDAAEALGSFYKGKHVGNHGLLSSLSFNGNKIVTTGGGGAILTNDTKIAKRAKHITTTAKIPHPFLYQHDEVGYNYRLPNINAALGCAQLEKIDYFIDVKRKLAKKYYDDFKKIPGMRFLIEPTFAKSNYWLNGIFVDVTIRDPLLTKLNAEKIGVRPPWELMHHLSMFANSSHMDLSTAEKITKQFINIPSSISLGAQYAKQCEAIA